MARALDLLNMVRSLEAHSYSYVTKMIDKTHRQGAFPVFADRSRGSAAQTPGIRRCMMT